MIGQLIKEARTAAKLTQEQLAWAVGGLTTNDIRKAEREEIFLSNDELKRIAKATRVTQKSLLDAAKLDKEAAMLPPMGLGLGLGMGSGIPAAPLDPGAAPLGRPGMAPLPPVPMGFDLSSTEQKLIEQFRAANSATKKAVKKLLKGDQPELVDLVNNGFIPGPMGPMGGMDPNAPLGGGPGRRRW